MIETADGKSVVMCDACGEEIESCGWIAYIDGDETLVCDDCAPMFRCDSEFRICDECGAVMVHGYCSDGADHVCEDCWEGFTKREYPHGFRQTEDEGCVSDEYCEAYDPDSGEWYETCWFWTEWD